MKVLKIYEFLTPPPPVTTVSPVFSSLSGSWNRMTIETELWLNHFNFTNNFIINFKCMDREFLKPYLFHCKTVCKCRDYLTDNIFFIKLKMKACFYNFVCDSHHLRIFYMHTYTNTHIHFTAKLVFSLTSGTATYISQMTSSKT